MSGRGRPRTAPGTHGRVSAPLTLANGDLQVSAVLRLHNGRTRRITGSGRTKAIATTNLEVAKDEALGTTGTAALNLSTTFSALGKMWLAEFKKSGRATGTIARYEASLNAAIERELGSLTLRELTNAGLRQFILGVADAGHIAEARNCRVVIRAVVNHAVNRGVCKGELINFVKLELALPLKKARAISLDELERLRAFIIADRDKARSGPKGHKAHDDLMDCIDLILATSGRISEVLAITEDRVDFAAGTVHIDRRVNYVKGEGLDFGPLKSEATERTIQLPAFALSILKKRFALGHHTAFTAARGGLLSQNNIRRTLRSITGGTEFEKWLTPHTGRKTVATAVNNELGSVIAGQVLGHDGDRLIITTYGERKTLAPNVTDITERFARRNTGT